jgi:hypothetical protein
MFHRLLGVPRSWKMWLAADVSHRTAYNIEIIRVIIWFFLLSHILGCFWFALQISGSTQFLHVEQLQSNLGGEKFVREVANSVTSSVTSAMSSGAGSNSVGTSVGNDSNDSNVSNLQRLLSVGLSGSAESVSDISNASSAGLAATSGVLLQDLPQRFNVVDSLSFYLQSFRDGAYMLMCRDRPSFTTRETLMVGLVR